MVNRVDTFTDNRGRDFPVWSDVDTALSLLRGAYPDGKPDDGWVFRGQADARWGLTPTMYRPPASDPILERRRDYTARFLAALANQSRIQISPSLAPTERSEDERLAIAQHYGFPTHLLDFTYSSHVAAYFATHGRPRDAEIGVIYALHQEEWHSFENPFACWGMSLPESAAILRESGLQPAPPISFVEPEGVPRIQLQKGIFVAVEDSGFDPLEVIIDRFYFLHQAGRVYHGPQVTEGRLFPFADPFAEFAADWRGKNPN